MTKEQLLAEIEDVLRTMPPRATIRHQNDQNFSWLARAAAVIIRWSPTHRATVEGAVDRTHSVTAQYGAEGVSKLHTLLHQARHDLRLDTVGPTNVLIQSGMVFDYFDEIRKIIETARSDVFFVDPYLDAEFVSRYLPHAQDGVAIRLLAREKMPSLLAAAGAFAQQTKANLQVRSATGFHDRYLFADASSCYQSGASFKDGARSAPTTLTEITDAFQGVWTTYQALWDSGKVER